MPEPTQGVTATPAGAGVSVPAPGAQAASAAPAAPATQPWTDSPAQPAAPAAPAAQPTSPAVDFGPVPYPRFREVTGKNKALEQENARLKSEAERQGYDTAAYLLTDWARKDPNVRKFAEQELQMPIMGAEATQAEPATPQGDSPKPQAGADPYFARRIAALEQAQQQASMERQAAAMASQVASAKRGYDVFKDPRYDKLANEALIARLPAAQRSGISLETLVHEVAEDLGQLKATQHAEYLQTKQATAAAMPAGVGGGPPAPGQTTPASDKPKNFPEANKRLIERFRGLAGQPS